MSVSGNISKYNSNIKNFRFNKKNMIDISLLVMSSLLLLSNSNQQDFTLIGIFIIIISLQMCYKSRNNRLLLLLICIISYINISVALNDMIFPLLNVPYWQIIGLRSTIYNLYFAQSYLLFTAILNLFIDSNKYSLYKTEGIDIRESNYIISGSFILISYIILILGIREVNSSGEGYSSVTNPIYEYSIILWLLIWFYSQRSKFFVINFLIYVIIYSFIFISIGDRSSVFMYIILMYILLFYKHISGLNILLMGLVSTLFANLIGTVRSNDNLALSEIVTKVIERGLYSDTVSFAYYSSISITALNKLDSSPMQFLYYQILSILFGISTSFSNLAKYAKDNYIFLFNYGGGIYPAHLYASTGTIGVIFGAILLGIIIKMIYKSNNKYIVLLQILIIIYSLRWYLYNMSNLYRTIFVNGLILILFVVIINKLTKKKNVN